MPHPCEVVSHTIPQLEQLCNVRLDPLHALLRCTAVRLRSVLRLDSVKDRLSRKHFVRKVAELCDNVGAERVQMPGNVRKGRNRRLRDNGDLLMLEVGEKKIRAR